MGVEQGGLEIVANIAFYVMYFIQMGVRFVTASHVPTVNNTTQCTRD